MTDRERPLVTVLMATYERADIVPRAIESVLSQDYPDLELVVVDDYSTDETEETVRTLAEADNRLQYIRHRQNKGFGSAINTAAANADPGAVYLAIIGDDDVWFDDQKLSKQVDAAEAAAEPPAAVVTGFRTINASDGEVIDVVNPTEPDDLEGHLLKRNGIISSTTALIPTSVWEVYDGFDERIPRGVDSDFFRRAIFGGYNVIFLPEEMVDIYLNRADRMTAKDSPEKFDPHIESELWKLRRYPEKYAQHPDAKSIVLQKIAVHYIKRYRMTRDKDDIRSARAFFTRSALTDKTNVISIGGVCVTSVLSGVHALVLS
jgi:glycosyltransferase involved in cell wall biosynthesis